MIQRIILLAVITLSTSAFGQNINDKIDAFLSKNVKNGLVNYSSIKESQITTLDAIISELNSLITEEKNNDNKSRLINLYNLQVIKQIVANYPTKSPMEIAGFFDKTKIKVKNNSTTINNLENKEIRKTYNDPRIHFALVCGAKGCPPIYSTSFRANTLESQLNNVTKKAINNDEFIKVDTLKKTAEISEIFRWYAEDFGSKEDSIISFINKFIESEKKIESFTYYPYNWDLNDQVITTSSSTLSNVATYTPSVLLKKGQIEVQIFNNLYTQTAWRDPTGTLQPLGSRGTWNTMLFTFNYGVSKSSRFNLGLDVNLRSTRTDAENSNAIDILKFEQNSTNRTTISTIGPKIKWNPIKSVSKFSIQSSFLIPVSDSLENKSNRPWLDYDRYTWWTQLFFDRPIGTKFQFFAEADLLMRIPKLSDENNGLKESIISTPLSVFFSYFPTSKSTVYAQYQYAPTLTSLPDYFMQAGIGGKYQLFPALQLELSYTNFFASRNNGAGSTYNVGLRYIR